MKFKLPDPNETQLHQNSSFTLQTKKKNAMSLQAYTLFSLRDPTNYNLCIVGLTLVVIKKNIVICMNLCFSTTLRHNFGYI